MWLCPEDRCKLQKMSDKELSHEDEAKLHQGIDIPNSVLNLGVVPSNEAGSSSPSAIVCMIVYLNRLN